MNAPLSQGELMAQQTMLAQAMSKTLATFKKIGKNNLMPAKIRSRLQSLKKTWLQFQSGHMKLTSSSTAAQQQDLHYYTEEVSDHVGEVYQSTRDYMPIVSTSESATINGQPSPAVHGT